VCRGSGKGWATEGGAGEGVQGLDFVLNASVFFRGGSMPKRGGVVGADYL